MDIEDDDNDQEEFSETDNSWIRVDDGLGRNIYYINETGKVCFFDFHKNLIVNVLL